MLVQLPFGAWVNPEDVSIVQIVQGRVRIYLRDHSGWVTAPEDEDAEGLRDACAEAIMAPLGLAGD